MSPTATITQVVRSLIAADHSAAHCVVCQAVLPRSYPPKPPPHDPYPSCEAVACRMVVSRHTDMGEAGFRHYLQIHTRHKQHLAAVEAAIVARRLADVGQNARAWSALRARLPAALAPEPLSLLLPSGPRRTRPLAAARRERYRAHLLHIVAEACGIETLEVSRPMPPAGSASTLQGQLCALCGGGCCTRGGERAYLSAATMRRFMDGQPQLSADEVVAACLDRLAVRTQTGFCINHTGTGCSLPKEMRSDICNRFSCESLARLQAAQRGPDAVHAVLVVRRKQDHWHRAEPAVDNAINAFALLREAGTRRFPHA